MEQKGNELMSEGERALTFSFASLFSSTDKIDKAHDKFVQAATQYKAAGKFTKAGEAYMRAADMSAKSKSEGDETAELEEAARAYAKAGSTSKAVELYSRVADMLEHSGKQVYAAKACAAAAEIANTPAEATQWLKRAQRLYASKGYKANSSELQTKLADNEATSGNYVAARASYDRLGREALDDRASRMNARKIFFSALLAQIASMSASSMMEDATVLQESFDEYQDMDTQFNIHTREHMLITAVIDAIMNDDVEKYDEAVKEYNSICPLNKTRKAMLDRGREVLVSHGGDLR